MERQNLHTEYGTTAIYTSGRYSKYPIVHVHGGPGFPDHSIIDSNLAESYDIIAYDQYGCGQSTELESGTYDISKFTSQLDEVISAYANQGAILYGSSWGTMVIAAYIQEYGTDKVRCIILSGPFLDSRYHNELSMKRIGELPEPFSSELKRCIEEDVTGEELYIAQRPYMYEYYAFGDEDRVDFYWCSTTTSYRELWGKSELVCTGKAKDYDYSHALDGIPIPVIIKMGDHDIMEVSKVHDIAQEIPDCTIIVAHNCGHSAGGTSNDLLSEILAQKTMDGYVSHKCPLTLKIRNFNPCGYDIEKIRQQGYRIQLDPNND